MDNESPDESSEPQIRTLSDLVIKYDMRKMCDAAKEEHPNITTSRELLNQQAISSFFNLGEN